MKRFLALLMVLCALLSLPSAGMAYWTYQDAILYSTEGGVPLYRKPSESSASVGVCPNNLRVYYDINDANSSWVKVSIGANDPAGLELEAYARRAHVLDISSLDRAEPLFAAHPIATPEAVLTGDTNVYQQADAASQVIGFLYEALPVYVLVTADEFSFVRIGTFSGFIPNSVYALTGETGDDSTAVFPDTQLKTVYCEENMSVPIYSTCAEAGLPPVYAPSYRNGDRVRVVSEHGDFVRVAYDNGFDRLGSGFIPARFFDASQSHEVETLVIRSSSPADRVNIRYSPNKDSTSMGKLFDGTPVQVLSVEGAWSYVQVGGVTGYVMNEFLAAGDDSNVPQTLVANDPLSVTKNGFGTTEPGCSYTVDAGTEMKLLGFATEYVGGELEPYVLCDGFYGNVRLEQVRPADDSRALEAKATDTLRIRALPYKDSDLLTSVKEGQRVTVLIHGEGWSYVRYEGVEGFASNKSLKF